MTHTTFQDEIATYLAGGLPPEESADFESHAKNCQACASLLAKEEQMDATMQDLFRGIFPTEGFESRLAESVRVMPRRIHPFVKAASTAAAAAVILGAVGYFGGSRFEPQPRRAHVASNLKQVGTPFQLGYGDEDLDRARTSVGNTFQVQKVRPNAEFNSELTVKSNENGVVTRQLEFTQERTVPRATERSDSAGQGQRPSAHGANTYAGTTVLNGGKMSLGAGDGGYAINKSVTNGPLAVKDAYLLPHQDVATGTLNYWYNDGRAAGTYGSDGHNVLYGDGHLDINGSYFKTTPTETGKLADVQQKELADKSGADDAKKGPYNDSLHHPTNWPDVSEARARAAHEIADLQHFDVKSPQQPAQATTAPASDRKIIRTGTMEFEVDSFDTAAERLTKIVAEEHGFVASTDSEKLPNGKVKGVITLRCPPEHLDTLVMKLRGLGDLKTQRITAADVTKQFTDFESQLRAARAMEERLLDIIKTGKGAVKDLVEAEKQLGIYREKIEHIEGELRYMNSQVSLSTLSVSLTERDIRSPFAAVQTETVNAGVEAEDVEKARAEAIKLIEEAKGRVIESDLKKMEAGQLAATIVADVSPDAAGPLGDKLKMLGHVSRWEAERKQTAQGGNEAPAQLPPNARLEKQATHFNLSIYNLANVAPRQRTGLTLVTNDVEAAYRSILAAVNGDGKNPPIGRVLASNLNSEKSDQINGSITLEVKSDQAAAIEAALHSAGSVMHLTVTDNADPNATTTKRGYGIAIISATTVPAREQQTLTVASKDVEATYNKLIDLLRDSKTAAHVTSSQLNQQDPGNVVGSLDFEIPTSARSAVEAIMSDGKQSDVTSRNVARAADTENTLADKLRLTVTINNADHLPPRETVKLTLEASDVQKALETAAAVGGSDARLLERNLTQQPDGASTGHLVIDVPLATEGTAAEQLRALGKVRSSESSKNPNVSSGPLARARFDVSFGNAQTLVAPEEGVGFSIRAGLRKALAGLLWSVEMVVIGVVLVGPFVLVAWIAWKLFRRRKEAASV